MLKTVGNMCIRGANPVVCLWNICGNERLHRNRRRSGQFLHKSLNAA